MKAIKRNSKISMPYLSCSICDAEIDSEIYEECVRRYENARKEELTKEFERVVKDGFDIIDCEFCLAAIDIGYARGSTRLKRLLDAQRETEKRLTDRFSSEVVFGADKGTDEYNRKDDILAVAKRELLSYGFDYDEYRKNLSEEKEK